MGGATFDKTNILDQKEYDNFINFIKQTGLIENTDYIFPFRLGNKNTFGDIDFIISDTDKFIKLFEENKLLRTNKYKIIEKKKIPLFEERFGLYSLHLLTSELYQIDLLKSWNSNTMEITRAYYSYSFANIFLKKLIDIVDRNLKFSYLGVFCSSNKFIIPENKFIQLEDNKTRLIVDCVYVFELIDLDYSRYILGFVDEIELLEYFKSSKYYSQIKFKFNSKFKHDYLRLKPFANLVDLGLIEVDNLKMDNLKVNNLKMDNLEVDNFKVDNFKVDNFKSE